MVEKVGVFDRLFIIADDSTITNWSSSTGL